mmetsp:Transcript_8640/g.11919  ORF Transcript_8640/g.11919 Transcript_8640/m.11919 type:complete len:104 (-) Transcript_8640:920-1231(-)
MKPQESSLSPGQQSAVYPAEYTSGCTNEKNTGKTFDPRYIENGLHTNQYKLRLESGVLDRERRLPHYWMYGPSDHELQSLKVSGWSRPTLSWKLECEADGKTR